MDEYVFAGWNRAADGSGKAYAEGDTIQSPENVTLYAQWKPAYYYITEDGDIVSMSEYNVLTAERATSEVPLDNGLWVVESNIASTTRLYVNKNNVTLVLLDSVTLDASKGGIEVIEGGTLNITTGNITKDIEGTGKLIAIGGEARQSGIGSGYYCPNGTVNIYGGTITATGNNNAAGIGGGFYGDGGTVNITGGTVTATGGTNGAGIGGGYKCSGGTVNISGGTVTATAGEFSTVNTGDSNNGGAIGGGSEGSTGNLYISGTADVTLQAGGMYLLKCSTAKATPNKGESVFVQDKSKNNLTTPSSSAVSIKNFSTWSYVHVFFAETENITIGTTGWASLYYGDYNLEIPDGVKAYIVTAADTTNCSLTKAEVTGVIPAGTAVMLWDNDTTKSNKYIFKVTAENNSADLSGNILRGYDVDSTTYADDYGTTEGYYFYKLSRNAAGDNESVGFYWHVDGGAAFTIPAHKAFMALEKAASGGAKAFLINGGDATGINGIRSAENANGKIYDTSGRFYGTDATRLSKGIYIRNGKKFVVK